MYYAKILHPLFDLKLLFLKFRWVAMANIVSLLPLDVHGFFFFFIIGIYYFVFVS